MRIHIGSHPHYHTEAVLDGFQLSNSTTYININKDKERHEQTIKINREIEKMRTKLKLLFTVCPDV